MVWIQQFYSIKFYFLAISAFLQFLRRLLSINKILCQRNLPPVQLHMFKIVFHIFLVSFHPFVLFILNLKAPTTLKKCSADFGIVKCKMIGVCFETIFLNRFRITKIYSLCIRACICSDHITDYILVPP